MGNSKCGGGLHLGPWESRGWPRLGNTRERRLLELIAFAETLWTTQSIPARGVAGSWANQVGAAGGWPPQAAAPLRLNLAFGPFCPTKK